VVKSREMRMRRLYQFAKVNPKWIGSPGAEEVLAHQLEMARDRVEAMLANGDKVPPAMLATAQHLLQGRDAAAVVAALLQKTAMGVRPPFEVHGARAMPSPKALAVAAVSPQVLPIAAVAASASPPAAPAVAAVAAPSTPAPAPAPTTRRLAADQRGRAGAAPSWQKRPERGTAASAGPAFQRFRINWGRRDGADPRRVMAHVCRRGHLESHMVGAISVQSAFTVFEIATEAAESFQRSAKKPDRRDPHLVIEREGGGGS
jgi:ATP-dependent RNA helicase DeaD